MELVRILKTKFPFLNILMKWPMFQSCFYIANIAYNVALCWCTFFIILRFFGVKHIKMYFWIALGVLFLKIIIEQVVFV